MVDPACVLDLGMDEIVGGKVLDKTANHNDGTLVGALHLPTLVPGKIGNGILLDGIDDHLIKAAFTGLPSSAISVVVWVKGIAINVNWRRVFDHEWGGLGSWLLFLKQDEIRFSINDGASKTGSHVAAISDGVWYHLVGVYNGAEVSLYVNAVKAAGTEASIGATLDSAGDIYIGGSPGVGVYLNAIIDEARIYNRALPIAEIRRIYDTGLNGHPNSIAALSKGVPTW